MFAQELAHIENFALHDNPAVILLVMLSDIIPCISTISTCCEEKKASQCKSNLGIKFVTEHYRALRFKSLLVTVVGMAAKIVYASL